ncbi:ATP-binding protein [Paenibacillus filicis]|uniref:histidine kinase n=1 Tax=Paenibacillus gyeongsangnamensis TaxID=3388067 RepID=A0ABT4QCE0_9BACL|nr:ATP-binding protein [Paenibacillus filicis]MCZ8514545.1 ATP-binding protein [Paenibacillus filicis]
MAKPQALHGTIDLRGYRFDKYHVVRLDGTWDFYWQQLLTPGQINSGTDSPEHVRMPYSWNEAGSGIKGIPASGYATYHLKILLDPGAPDLAVRVPLIRTSYRMWVNDALVAESGVVGASPEDAVPEYKTETVPIRLGSGSADITLQISNYHHRLGGVWKPLLLGTQEVVTRQERNGLAVDLLVIGSLLSMGLHHIGLFLLRRKEKSSIYFGVFCLLVGIRALFVNESVVYSFLPDMSWLTGIRIEYTCFFLAVPAVIMFTYSLYPKETHRNAVRFVQGAAFLSMVLLFALPAPYFTYEVPVYQLITIGASLYVLIGLGQALVRGREGALFAVVGGGAYVSAIITDILYYNELIGYGDVSNYGLLVCVFMISFILSSKSAKAFTAVETLSRQMREMNVNLESKIRERTAELERTNASLERMNEDLARLETSRRHLLSNISHDLGTPMTLIQGYVEALLDGVVTQPEQQRKYLELIYNRTTGLNRLITDLFQLSKLEARQMNFDIQPMTVEEFIRYFGDLYELEVSDAGLRFEKIATSLQPQGASLGSVNIDVDRIGQVLTNIIFNAVKHTPQGGLIQLYMIVDEHALIVQVQDNGSGIDPEDLPFIFDRFYKKDKSRNTAQGGSGLGLAIAKEIIDYHGGRIWAQSRVGQGACIAFMLPLSK